MSGMSGGGPEGAAVPPGRVVAGRYRLLEQLGRGGMGVVWRARDEVLDRDVAVKEVRAPAGLLDHEIRQLYVRLEREARAAARIAHPHVVTVFDVASDEGRPWIVMELVRGLSLADALQTEGPMPPAHAAHIGAGVLSALRGAHAAGVLHRDVKPGNVLLANDGRVVLTDFGIATVEGSSALTRTGELVGSPEFLAPERALGHPPGPASDLWSLGVTLYAAVEGVSPFRQDTPLSTMRAVVDQQLPAPVRAGALAPVLEGLLRKDPALRLGAEEAEEMLRVVARGGTVPGAGATPGSDATTLAAHTPPHDPAGSPAGSAGGQGGGFGPPEGGAPAGPAGDGARRRPAVVLAVAAVVLALLAGGLVWAFTRSGGDSSSGPPAAPDKNAGAGQAGSSSGKSPDAGGAAGGSPSGVRASVEAERDAYTGTCPPQPVSSGPAFRVTFTVDRSPVRLVYHWITGSGQVGTDQSVDVTNGKTVMLRHFEAPRDSGKDWIGVEVTDPQKVTSNHVSFTVTCRGSSSGRPPDKPSSPGPASPSRPPGPSPSASTGPTYGYGYDYGSGG
ncbi:serine/threonine protein kinase [Streptomyces roseoverticillatus]|uniref:serine/threonine-protein kinase n=1 Tax=Streptomyces roseoverticillatus TaxID=66429 RepID=UPI001F402574|nr:serine/threonine-protein kinase [Streptomyces roseoverticillatus]MCF3100681.1 serine/threonine protein kinase [Streptomyces roseoverticillatus]